MVVAVKPGSELLKDVCFGRVVRDATAVKNFSDRAIRSAHHVEKVEFFNGMRGDRIARSKKLGIEKGYFFQ